MLFKTDPMRRYAFARRTGVLSMAIATLFAAGCQTGGPRHVPPIETRDESGFSISEAVSIPSRSRSDFDKATRAIEEEDYDQAIELLESVVLSSPQLAAAHINLGIAYQRAEDFEKAEAALLLALEANPRHPVAHNELGIVYRRMGQFENARASYEVALKLHPDFHFARKNLGILCDLFLSDPECALEHYELYYEADPKDEAAEIWIADLRKRAGKKEN
jgi:Flp pilus assembly protein TadD